jgi:hypothetical protein
MPGGARQAPKSDIIASRVLAYHQMADHFLGSGRGINNGLGVY